ncbi:MAG: RidA family protein [Alphaproteobacteria bacterium]|nr:RidA family protein [Alphaproteobacteria bacterium]
MAVEERLKTLGLALPPPHAFPNPNRIGCVRTGDLVFVSGHPPAALAGVKVDGKVTGDLSLEEAQITARACALNMLASIKAALGSLDKVARVVKINGMVNSSPGFIHQYAVIDGASDLFVHLFGPVNGPHARSAVGMFELPRNIAVEVEGVFEVAG